MARSAQPNVIVFFTDQQRWDCSGLHGNPLDLMPNFDRMAQEGTHLFHSITCQPVCGPARSCLQTGKHATNTGCYRNGIPLRPDEPTLATHFKEAGYQTAYIGKWHLADRGDPTPREQQGGYEFWRAANVLEFASDAYDFRVYDEEGRSVRRPGYRVDAQTDEAIAYIDAHRDNPFFLFLSYLEPHHQNHIDDYPPPDFHRERYTGKWIPPDLAALGGSAHQHLGGYYGMVKRLDDALGRLRDALKTLGLLENTIILFTSDHGCHFKTRNSEYKRSCHESSVRVPTFFHGPGFMGGGRREELVSLVDLPPTLLDAAGIAPPDSMEGRSLMPRLRAPGSSDWPDDVFIQISESHIGRAVRTRKWKYAVAEPGSESRGGAKPAAERYEETCLYDLDADPYELTNLIGLESHQPVAERMRQRLLAHIERVEGARPEIVPAPSRKSGQRIVQPREVDL